MTAARWWVSGFVLGLGLGMLLGVAMAQPADAVVYPVENADHQVAHVQVTYVEFDYDNAMLYVEFNSGATAFYSPCWRRSQAGNCYWVPAARVNETGPAWVVVKGRRLPIAQRLLVEAGLNQRSAHGFAAKPQVGRGLNEDCISSSEFRHAGITGTLNQTEAYFGVSRGVVVRTQDHGQVMIRRYSWCDHYLSEGYFQIGYGLSKAGAYVALGIVWIDFTCHADTVDCGHHGRSL